MKRIVMFILLFIAAFSAPLAAADSQALLEQGLEAFKSSNYRNAELLFRKCMEIDDNNAEKAWFYLARSLYSQKKYKDAIFEFNRYLLDCRSNELCSESRYWIAESYFSTSEYLKSIEEFKRYISQNKIKDNPLAALSHERIGEIYSKQSRYDEAVIEWKLAQEMYAQADRKAMVQIRICEALFLNKKYEEAESLLAVLSEDKDKNVAAQANILLGRIASIGKKPRIALRYYSQIPDSLAGTAPYSDVLYFKALTYLDIEDKDSAKNFLQTFISISKNSLWFNHARFQLSMITQLQNPDDSIATMNDIRKMTGDIALKADVTLALARLYTARGITGESVSILEDVRSIEDQDRKKDILFELGSAYMSLKKFDAAETVFTEMLSKYSFDKDADKIQFLLAVVYLKKGDTIRASAGFTKIAELNPFSLYIGESYYYMASAQFEQGNYSQTLKFIDEYFKNQNPDKLYEASLLQLKSLISMNNYAGTDKAAQNLIRRFYDKVGIDAAVVDVIRYAYTLKKDPSIFENFILRNFPGGDSAAQVFLIKAHYEFSLDNWKKAEQFYTQFLKIKGNEYEPSAFINKAKCLYNIGNYKGVIEFLTNEKLEVFSTEYSSSIVLLLAKSHFRNGEYEKSYQFFSVIKDYISADEDLYLYFEASLKNDNLNAAKDISSRLRSNKNLYYKSLYVIGVYYKDIFNYEDARGYFSRIYTDYPDTLLSEMTLLELAQLDIKDARYEDAINRLKSVKSKDLDTDKNIIVIAALYKMNRYPEGMDILKKNINTLVKEAVTKALLKSTIEYLISVDDISNIIMFGRYFSSAYPDEQHYVNFSIANFYFRTGNFNKAYSFYIKIPVDKGEFRTEVLYRLGMISELFYKNTRSAFQFLQQLSDSGESDEYVTAGNLELALLNIEKNQKDQSLKILKEIVGRKENVAAIIKASNIIDYYHLDAVPAVTVTDTAVKTDGMQ